MKTIRQHFMFGLVVYLVMHAWPAKCLLDNGMSVVKVSALFLSGAIAYGVFCVLMIAFFEGRKGD